MFDLYHGASWQDDTASSPSLKKQKVEATSDPRFSALLALEAKPKGKQLQGDKRAPPASGSTAQAPLTARARRTPRGNAAASKASAGVAAEDDVQK